MSLNYMPLSICSIIARVAILVSISAFVSGCVALAPVMQTYSQIGVSEGDRMRLLDTSLSEFSNAVYWGNANKALTFASDQAKEDLKNHIRQASKQEKVVETEVEFVDYDDDVYAAEVDVLVKYYKVPQYVVKERRERQFWQFSVASGWEYHGRKDVA